MRNFYLFSKQSWALKKVGVKEFQKYLCNVIHVCVFVCGTWWWYYTIDFFKKMLIKFYICDVNINHVIFASIFLYLKELTLFSYTNNDNQLIVDNQ